MIEFDSKSGAHWPSRRLSSVFAIMPSRDSLSAGPRSTTPALPLVDRSPLICLLTRRCGLQDGSSTINDEIGRRFAATRENIALIDLALLDTAAMVHRHSTWRKFDAAGSTNTFTARCLNIYLDWLSSFEDGHPFAAKCGLTASRKTNLENFFR
jgi:hypothetical protein